MIPLVGNQDIIGRRRHIYIRCSESLRLWKDISVVGEDEGTTRFLTQFFLELGT